MNSIPSGTALQNGKFVLENVLGQGSFGMTYKALMQTSVQGDLGSLKTSINVAVKEFFMNGMNTRGSDGSWVEGSDGEIVQNYRRKFRKEAENLSRLDHPNIVKVLSIFDENNTTYYVMEYLDGESLDQRIARKGWLEEEEAISVIRQVGSALRYMHQHQMLHLDLKPGNVMCTHDGRTVLIDFGLSKQYDEKGEPESSTTLGHGTLGYAPIEQADYRQDGTFPATLDIYALGATFFKTLTGIRPLSASELLNDDGFLQRNLVNAGVSPHTIAVVCKAMAYRRKDRFQTVEEFLQALSSPDSLYDEKTELASLETEETELSRPLPTPHSGSEPESPHQEEEVEPDPSPEPPKVTTPKPEDKSRKGLFLGYVAFMVIVTIVVYILLFKSVTPKYIWAIPATYDWAGPISEGLADAKINGKYGFIDTTGKFVIPAIYDYANHFSEGLACVDIDGKYGFIDKTGNIVIHVKYDYAYSFSDGLAIVSINDKWGCIDKTGNLVIPTNYDAIWGFSEGLAAAEINGKYGFIDKTGKLVIPAMFNAAGSFSEGLTTVEINGKYSFIDKSCKPVIPATFDDARPFSEGLAAVKIKGKWGYVDRTGSLVIPATYDWVGSFSEGLASVKNIDDSGWGFIDKTGKLVIPATYERVNDFSEGLSNVSINDKWGFIDKTGKLVIPAKFDMAYVFSEGFACVKRNGKCGYIKYNK